MDIIKLVDSKISVDEICQSVTSSKCGAISLFVGTTRDNFEAKKVIRLEYEAYEAMAIKEIQKICNELRDKWTLEHIAIIHRLGLVPVTEASIVIAISSEHRKESLEAVQQAIDVIKATVPIWKKEVYEGESTAEGESSGPNTSESSVWKSNQEYFWNKK